VNAGIARPSADSASTLTTARHRDVTGTCAATAIHGTIATGHTAEAPMRSRQPTRSDADTSRSTRVPPVVATVLRTPGRELHPADRAPAEARLRHDLRDVRIHADPQAAASARAIGAAAYTFGRHVVFGAARFRPGSTEGRRLLLHELAHVVQQRDLPAGTSPVRVADAHATAERAADRHAAGAASRPALAPASGPPAVHRQRVPDQADTVPIQIPSDPSPAATVDEARRLAELVKVTSDAVRRDELVRSLRTALTAVQRWIGVAPGQDVGKLVDEAIGPLLRYGADQGVMAILKEAAGRSATRMPDTRDHIGPALTEADLGKRFTVTSPKIRFGAAPKRPARITFEYVGGLRGRFTPDSPITFTLAPPADFASMRGVKRVTIVAAADQKVVGAPRYDQRVLEGTSAPVTIVLRAPLQPGRYVIRVEIGSDVDRSSIRVFDVVPGPPLGPPHVACPVTWA
jgi:hypothetical protein